MEPKKITPDLSITGQVSVEEVATLSKWGFKSVINNRPDGEQAGQPESTEIEAAAKAAGLAYRYIPVTPGQMTEEKVVQFAEAIEDLPRPVLAFCRSGTRSISLYCLAEAESMPSDELIGEAAKAGYDLEGLRSLLEERAARLSRNPPQRKKDMQS
jgi:sulfide:quinone oxidoreductase